MHVYRGTFAAPLFNLRHRRYFKSTLPRMTYRANLEMFYSPFFHLPGLPVLLLLKYRSSCVKLGSHGATAVIQCFPFVTATNGASACGLVSVRVCVCVIVASYRRSRIQGHGLENGGGNQLFCSFTLCPDAVCCYCAF